MANQHHLDLIKQGVEVWNQWRQENSEIKPDLSEVDLAGEDLHGTYLAFANLNEADLTSTDLSGANLTGALLFMATLVNSKLDNSDLSGADLTLANLTAASLVTAKLTGTNLVATTLVAAKLTGADLVGANLSKANLSKASLSEANLSGADLTSVNLRKANLSKANLKGANLSRAVLHKAFLGMAYLSEANLKEADLTGADLSSASLTNANLSMAILNEVNLKNADLTGSSVYGISTWNVYLEGTRQLGLIVDLLNRLPITVDNLEIAQFVYLLFNNQKIRDVIDIITSKLVLILGRFTYERKQILDGLRDELRKYNYLPVMFDFDKPGSRSVTETSRTLAHLSRFIIADITSPQSVLLELGSIVPFLRVPVLPLLQEDHQESYVINDLRNAYHWVLPIYYYKDLASLLESLKECVIEPAEQKAQELEKRYGDY